MLLNTLVLIVIATYLIGVVIDYLNQKNSNATLDPLIADLYDPDERSRSVNYSAENSKLSFYSSSFSTAIMILALGLGWFAQLDNWIRNYFSNGIQISLIFIAILSVISWLISVPFNLYGLFKIESKYGFNKVTPKTYIEDTLKGLALTVLIAGPLLTLILWLYQVLKNNFWIWSWVALVIFSTIMFMFSTTLILPLFNKLKPLESGDLRDEIEKYCATQGYSLGRLFVMDGSKRSTKANAFFSGLGKSKTIVLFDTLIEKLSTKEVLAVLAHEIGHYKLKHTLSMYVFSNLQTLGIFALLGWLLQFDELSTALGATQSSFHLSAIAFFILITPLSLILGLITNSWSRYCEYQADTFSKETYDSKSMQSALRKISTDSLANLTPHPIYVAFNYSHPTLIQRIKNIS
jgi:STE24 endopeptidase